MFEDYERKEEFEVIKAIGKIRECCNYHQNVYKNCYRCMLYNSKEQACFFIGNFKSPKNWKPIIKIEL